GKETITKELIEEADPKKKSITWKVIEGDLLEFYSSFTINLFCEHQCATWTLLYKKKTAAIPDPQ
ncbi:hypothetical protein HAX54_043021, partial [Datura stramonium]|nr:hypothetical protein [Datura stramonium]